MHHSNLTSLFRYKLEHYDWFIKVDDDTYLRKDYMLFDVMKATGNMGDGPLRVGELFCHPEYNSCYIIFFYRQPSLQG